MKNCDILPRGETWKSAAGERPRTQLKEGPTERDEESAEKRRPTWRMEFRPYQWEAFRNHTDGIQVWLWGRQTGKSFTLAAWAVERLFKNPGRLVTILSNSKANGVELNRKCAEVCERIQQAFEQEDLSADARFETMSLETRVIIDGKVGRIKVLAANPRTARGFSGDLILDEFAFHENSTAIWEAAEPILAANRDYLCRIASTPNGKHNEFYRLATDPNIPRVTAPRSQAWREGCPVFHPITREPITPDEARALAANKRSYDQNYECVFEDENMTLLTYDLITAAERADVGEICSQAWSEAILRRLRGGGRDGESGGPGGWDLAGSPCLYAGIDVGRHHDRTVISVIQKAGSTLLVRAILRLEEMRLPDQQNALERLLELRTFAHAKIDATGIGLGLYEYTHQRFGRKITGLNFSSSAPWPTFAAGARSSAGAPSRPTIRVTEQLATQLLQTFEDRAIQIPIDPLLRHDLRKPERLTSPAGRVSIAATRDATGHADHFWSLALAIDAAKAPPKERPTELKVIPQFKRPFFNTWKNGITF